MVSGGHAIVYVSDMDRAIRFYTDALGLRLTYRHADDFATAEAGKFLLAIHPRTPRTPTPGAKGSIMLGLTVDEPIDRVVSRLAARGVRISDRIIRTETNSFVELEDPDGNEISIREEIRVDAASTENRKSIVSAG
jgi:catechol 2,3-dioxygenase-like lactoylglutathione lyase family enzyme